MSEEPGGKSKKKKWDQTKIVDESLLIEKSSFQPIFKLGSKILFGLLLFAMVLLTTSLRKKFDINWYTLNRLASTWKIVELWASQIGYLILFQDFSSNCTGCLFYDKAGLFWILLGKSGSLLRASKMIKVVTETFTISRFWFTVIDQLCPAMKIEIESLSKYKLFIPNLLE